MTQKPKFRRNPERVVFILRQFRLGQPAKAIAKTLKVSQRTVERILTQEGKVLKKGRPLKLLDADVERLYQLISAREITYDIAASQFGVSENTIRRRVREYVRERSRHYTGQGNPKSDTNV